MQEPAVQKRRFLAIDDNSDSAELVARVAAKCGYEARWLADPRDCLKLLREWLPDVITLDLCMPEEDGLTLVGALTESGFAGQVVIVSGQDGWIRKSARRLATARGLNVAEDFRKPVDIRAFGQFLTRLSEAPPPDAARTEAAAGSGPGLRP